MATNEVEVVQSFLRRYINKAVKEHFKDAGNKEISNFSLNSPREATKRVCLHQSNDPLLLTLVKLVIWLVIVRGLLDEYIFGMPSTQFDISNTYYPQVKLHFRENKYSKATINRTPARGEISFRWRETDYSENNINKLINKLVDEFAKPTFFYQRGRQLWTYADKTKGYYFQLTVDSEVTAKKVIKQVINVQDVGEPDWDNYLKLHQDKKNYSTQQVVKVMNKNIKSPKKRPIAKVEFAYAELFIPGTNKAIVLVDKTGRKVNALKYV